MLDVGDPIRTLLRVPRSSIERLLGPVALVAYATVGVMVAFEMTKESLFPGMSAWGSHAMTICFTSAFVTVAGYFVLRYQRTLNRRFVDRTLERSEANLKTAQELAHLGGFEISIPPSSDDYWSDEMYRIVGVDPSRPPLSLEAFAQELVHAGDRAHFEEHVGAGLRDGTAFDFSFRIRRPDGSVRYVQSVGQPVRDRSGRVAKAVGSMLDVTARRRAEEGLRKSEAQARAFLESVGETVVAIARDGRIVQVNQRLEEMFGYHREEVLGQPLEMLLPERLRGNHKRHRSGYFAAPRVRPMGQGLDLVAQKKDGTEFPIEVSLSTIEADDGPLGLAFVSDISERKRTEGALREAQRTAHQQERLADVGALTSKIVHDLGNPLAGLSMSAQQIARRLARAPNDPLETVRPPAEHLVATVRRLDTLIEDFKTFVRDQRLDIRDLDLGDLLRELVSVWQPEARAHGIELDLGQAGDGQIIQADRAQLRRLLDNLAKNALEAIGEGPGRIGVAAAVSTPDRVRISVEDTGPGIPEGANVFDLFETTKPDGTGLGLAIAKEIAVAHGGGIEFAAVRPNGAVFTVELPRNGPTL